MLRPRRQPPARGFTLVEVLVTLTILGVLLMATVPSVAEWMRNTEVRAAAESLTTGVQKARAAAVQRNEPVYFSLVSTASDNPGVLNANCALSSTSASWVVSLASPAGQCDVDPSDTTAPQILDKHAHGESSPRVVAQVKNAGCAANATTQQVRFDTLGKPKATPAPIACIELTHSGGSVTTLQVRIGTDGSVRSCVPGATGSDPRACPS